MLDWWEALSVSFRIISGFADQHIVTGAADEDVIAVAARNARRNDVIFMNGPPWSRPGV